MLHNCLGCIDSPLCLKDLFNKYPSSQLTTHKQWSFWKRDPIEIHQISTSKAEEIRDSDVHSSPWFPPQRSCRYLSVQGNDHRSLKSWQGSPPSNLPSWPFPSKAWWIELALTFHPADSKRGWIESLVLACSESPSLGAKIRSNCTQSCGNSWCWSFPHVLCLNQLTSLRDATKCFLGLGPLLQAKKGPDYHINGFGSQPTTYNLTIPSLKSLVTSLQKERQKPRAQDRDTPASAGGQPHVHKPCVNLFKDPMLWDPKNWGHGASIFLRYTV